MEIEARFINLSRDEIEKKLKELDASKQFESMFQEWIFFYPEWEKKHRRIRVRTDGKTTWLTYKANPTRAVDSTEEVELTVSSAEDAVRLVEAMGIPQRRYQEKKRIQYIFVQYIFGDILFVLDFWPKIPMVVEIEAPDEAGVRKGTELLGLKWEDAIFVDQAILHRDYYNIDLNEIEDYRFDKTD